MKILARSILKDGSGFVKLVAQEPDDVWHIYNLLAKGDFVTASTFRKVNTTSASTGATSISKLKVTLKVCIEDIQFDSSMNSLRLKGKNVSENDFVKLGQYHTLEVGLHDVFSLEKAEWDSIYLYRLDLSLDETKSAEVGAVVFQMGIAHICLLTTFQTLIKQKIEVAIPRKRSGRDVGVRKFYSTILDAIRRHFDFAHIKCVVIASPGFLKDDLFKYIMEEANRQQYRDILEVRQKFVLAHSSSGFKHSLKEVMGDPTVISRINETKAFDEVAALEKFFETLNTDTNKAYYGLEHCEFANEMKAIDVLLVSDSLFRASDPTTRKRYVALVDGAKTNKAEVRILSSQHVSGEQLHQLSGVAAILRFPMEEQEFEEHKKHSLPSSFPPDGNDEKTSSSHESNQANTKGKKESKENKDDSDEEPEEYEYNYHVPHHHHNPSHSFSHHHQLSQSQSTPQFLSSEQSEAERKSVSNPSSTSTDSKEERGFGEGDFI